MQFAPRPGDSVWFRNEKCEVVSVLPRSGSHIVRCRHPSGKVIPHWLSKLSEYTGPRVQAAPEVL